MNYSTIPTEYFLRQDMLDLLEDLPVNLIRDMCFRHDSCPAYCRKSVREWLDANYPNKWITRGEPISWPARTYGNNYTKSD